MYMLSNEKEVQIGEMMAMINNKTDTSPKQTEQARQSSIIIFVIN